MPSQSIAFFMHDFAGGGVERMRLALAGEFVRRGYKVHIIVVRACGPLIHDVPCGVKIVDLASHRIASAILRLRRHVRASRPDVVISSLDHNNIAALLACMFSGNRPLLIICQHNALSSELQLGLRYRAVPWLYWLLHSWADGIVAVSEGVADDMARVAGIDRKRIAVVPNPVINRSSAQFPEAETPHPWFNAADLPVFVFVGRLVEQKDPLMLIAAFAHRVAMGPARLIILGEGALQSEMSAAAERAGISDAVFFAGFIAQPFRWLARASALVLTSRYEGFGNVIVEALACGTPVIATNCPHGPSEILGGGEFGVLISPGDVRAVAHAMTRDLRAEFPAEMLRARGRAYTVEHAVDHHEALLARLTRRPAQAFGLTFAWDSSIVIGARIAEQPASAVQLVVTPNLDHVRLFQQPAFRKACSSAQLVCADGWPVALYAGLRHAAPWQRVTGCDILHSFLANSAFTGKNVFAIVESNSTARALQAWLSNHGLGQRWMIEVAVVDFANSQGEQLRVARAIGAAMPDVIIMTIGAPVSEVFIDVHREILPPCWALCIGQALRIELGLVARAPQAWRFFGLEWAWRCLIEPKRLVIRYVRDLFWFPRAVINDIFPARQ